MLITLGIYYVTPWIRWDRGEFAPDQAVLLDLYNRRFYFFWVEIWPQEFYYVAGLLLMAALGLFLVTSSVGRAWCGYTCPQTVWADLFLVVERFIEGDRNDAHAAGQGADECLEAREAGEQARHLAADRRRHRRRVDLLFRRCPDPAHGRRDRRRADGRLRHHRRADLHHLFAGRPDARAGLHLHVPVAADPGGDARRTFADRDLQ
ncbi:MAG: 4Fe-4S binding protein [Thalassobaculum sp.]